ncbi:unnamed protein product [Microthlaspi erraticum]|uniref:Uncharacterized protein n=1 Tax=Microthlaspi erraticum TaxID=1685480 RepID=A0A6D2JCP6_9BRAS|nr:unnamed protein product [Microthlaspi erraticum]
MEPLQQFEQPAPPRPRSHTHFKMKKRIDRVEWSAPDGRLPLQTTTLPPSSLGGTEAKFGGANSSSIELGVKNQKSGLLEHLEHMGREEQGRTWCMDAARPSGRVPQLDRPSFNSIELRSQSQTRKMLLPP